MTPPKASSGSLSAPVGAPDGSGVPIRDGCEGARDGGVTLVELVLVLVLLAILAGVAGPRFFSGPAFRESFFADDVIAALRHAQKLAVASGCDVRVSFSPPGSFSLAQRQGCRIGPFDRPVPNPGTGEPAYAGQAPPGAALASSVDPILFDALGRARDGTLAVSDATVTVGARGISVIGETGYVFDPAS